MKGIRKEIKEEERKLINTGDGEYLKRNTKKGDQGGRQEERITREDKRRMEE